MVRTLISVAICFMTISGSIQSQSYSLFIADKLAERWAPLVFLAPGEKFYPLSVSEFLDNVLPVPLADTGETDFSADLPKGTESETWSLVTKDSVDDLLRNQSSFLYGRNPNKYSVPVYAHIVPCTTNERGLFEDDNVISGAVSWPSFQVTYWMFYPYNQGKAMCTVDMGRFGPWPIPKVNGNCLGAVKEFGNHVGDWEHVTLYFKGAPYPLKMYVSSHDVGAIYRYDKGNFIFERREVRKGILQRPNFPAKIILSIPSQRPVLFAAKGSHGLWASPGKHRFVRLPRLHDVSGFGAAWQTWKNLVILRDVEDWMRYRGRWGNPKSQCHPAGSSLGIHICELSDGPKGIPTKKLHFQCHR